MIREPATGRCSATRTPSSASIPTRLADPGTGGVCLVPAVRVRRRCSRCPVVGGRHGTATTRPPSLIGVAGHDRRPALIGRLAERSVVRSAARQVLILLGACGITYALGRAIGVNVS